MEAYQQCKQRKAQGKRTTPLSARQAAWLFVCNPRKLKLRQVWELEPIRLHDEDLRTAYQFAQDFRTMITQRQVVMLEPWLGEVQEREQNPRTGQSGRLRSIGTTMPFALRSRWSGVKARLKHKYIDSS